MPLKIEEATRTGVPLLIGIAGGTGSGKTYTAMRLAKGMAGGKRFFVLDTESGRARAYADDFAFDTAQLSAPFRPDAYRDAIVEVEKLGKYPVIVVDSASHEYAGEGGVVDWHETSLNEMVERALKNNDTRARWQLEEANKMRAWIEPKMSHKQFVTRLTQCRAHVIMCFRAESKTEMAKENGKTVIRPKQGLTGFDGWFPLCEKNLPFEMTAYFLLKAEKPGCPLPIKLMERHRQFFPADAPITEETGVKLAAWAKGSPNPTAAPEGSGGGQNKSSVEGTTPPKAAVECFNENDRMDLQIACHSKGLAIADVEALLIRRGHKGGLDKYPRDKKDELLAWVRKQGAA